MFVTGVTPIISPERTLPVADRDVKLSISNLFLMSISKPYRSRKSAPKIGCGTSATRNDQVKHRRKPRFSSMVLVPYVAMEVLLAA